MQADPALGQWVLLVGSGSLKLRSWLVGMGLPPGKALPARRSFFQGSAHPVFLPTSPVVTPQGSLTLFDAGTFYSSCLLGALYGGYLEELVAACERSCVLLLQAEPLDATSRSLVQLARLCGVERAIVLGKPAAAKELNEELLTCGLPDVVTQTSGSLSAAAKCRCGQIGCGHCAPLRELVTELDATPGLGEQLDTDLALQRGEARRHGGLRDDELLRGATDRAELGDGREHLQLMDRQHAWPPRHRGTPTHQENLIGGNGTLNGRRRPFR